MEKSIGVISARVTLPISVDPAVRTTVSSETWATERMAKQDAAFEAYTVLYKSGLVNNNLLPAHEEADDDDLSGQNIPDNTPSLVQASPTFDPWPSIAQCQQITPQIYYRTLLSLHGVEANPIHMVLLTPASLPSIADLVLYWNHSVQFELTFSCLSSMTLTDEGMLQ